MQTPQSLQSPNIIAPAPITLKLESIPVLLSGEQRELIDSLEHIEATALVTASMLTLLYREAPKYFYRAINNRMDQLGSALFHCARIRSTLGLPAASFPGLAVSEQPTQTQPIAPKAAAQ